MTSRRGRTWANASRHLLDARVQLVVIGGLPGTGKTTLAVALGDELGWPVLRSDEIRKELAGLDPREPRRRRTAKGSTRRRSPTPPTRPCSPVPAGCSTRGVSVILDASFSEGNGEPTP